MKKTMVFALAACLAVSAFLTGCGDKTGDKDVKDPAHSPGITDNKGDDMMPDVNDGIVTDDDGIIDDRDPAGDDRHDIGDVGDDIIEEGKDIIDDAMDMIYGDDHKGNGGTGAGSGEGIGTGKGVIGN